MTVQDFLKELDGVAPVARNLGLPLSTVAEWAQRNSVPSWRIGALAKLAHERGKVMPADFGPSIPRKRDKAA